MRQEYERAATGEDVAVRCEFIVSKKPHTVTALRARTYPVSTSNGLVPDPRAGGHLASPPTTSFDPPRGSCGHSILGCPDVNHHPGAGCLRGLLEQCALEVGLHYYHARASVTTRS